MSVLSRRSTVEELLAQVPTNEEGSNAAVILLGSLTTFSFDGSQSYDLGMTWLFAFSLQDFKDGFSGVVVRWYATFETAGERMSLGSLLAGTCMQTLSNFALVKAEIVLPSWPSVHFRVRCKARLTS